MVKQQMYSTGYEKVAKNSKKSEKTVDI